MNIYKIKKDLEKQQKVVFTINEIARISKLNKKSASVYVNRMLKNNILYRVEKNKLTISEDPFIIASQLNNQSYLSLTTALYLHNKIEQIINKIYIITTIARKPLKINGMEIVFVKTSRENMYGYKRVKKENSFIMLGDLEKTIIDCIDHMKYIPINYMIQAIKESDPIILQNYAEKSGKEGLIRRLGYLMDILNIKNRLKIKTKNIYKLNPKIKTKGKFNNKWHLYINEEVKC